MAEHGFVPTNGQAADELNERNIRFYRTAGLVEIKGRGTADWQDGRKSGATGTHWNWIPNFPDGPDGRAGHPH